MFLALVDNHEMSGTEIGLALSVFLACTVEAVEALTIVLAVGKLAAGLSAQRGRGRDAALAGIVAVLGPANHLSAYRPAEGAGGRPAVDLRAAVAA